MTCKGPGYALHNGGVFLATVALAAYAPPAAAAELPAPWPR